MPYTMEELITDIGELNGANKWEDEGRDSPSNIQASGHEEI